MKATFWKIRLAFWIFVFGYGYRRTRIAGIARFAFADCWDSFREDGYPPREALIEDASNA
jgi:hypothetical protein